MASVHKTYILKPTDQRTTSGQTTGFDIAERNVAFYLNVSAAPGTGNLDVFVEGAEPELAGWVQIAAFTQVNTVGSERVVVAPLPDQTIRIRWVVSGGSPDFTFNVSASAKD